VPWLLNPDGFGNYLDGLDRNISLPNTSKLKHITSFFSDPYPIRTLSFGIVVIRIATVFLPGGAAMNAHAVSCVVGGIALMVLSGCAGSRPSDAGGRVTAAEVDSIASAFVCTCGCDDLRLDECPPSCPNAPSAYMYIRQLLSSDKYSREQILSMVDGKYGDLQAGAKK
jgi:hypothetical protein